MASPASVSAPATSTRHPAAAWLPPILLLAAAVLAAPAVPPWVWMWTLALAVFAGFKWLTWRRVAGRDRALAYLLLWPGMDAVRFTDPAARPSPPAPAEWAAAPVKIALGAGLVWGVARWTTGLAAGWVGMVGLVLMLHSGLFHLVSLLWRRAGVDARPLMNAPLRATSLASFWGDRWNRGFSDLAAALMLRPFHRVLGGPGALLAVFVVSGVLHDLVISLPAGAGWGLPTGYFVVQGLGALAERSPAGRRLGLGAGPTGRLLTAVAVAAPLFWLFHPPFVRRVMLPMLRAIGAL